MKKLLFCPDFQADFGADGLHVGLYELEDWDIYEYPEKKSVHGGCDSGYDLPGEHRKGMTGCGSHLMLNPAPGPYHTKEEIFDLFPNYDLIVMGIRDYSRRAIRELCGAVGLAGKLSNLVIVDEDDSDYLDRDLMATYNPPVFFKRELLRDYSLESYASVYGRLIMPLPFSAYHRAYPEVDDVQKGYDICLFLGRTWPSRDDLLRSFLALVGGHRVCPPERAWIATNGNSPLFGERYGEHLHELSPWVEYLTKQAQSKITAVNRGYGRDTMHALEAFSYETLVLYVEPGIYMPHPFRDGVHCKHIYESGFSLLDKIVRPLLREDEYRQEIARAGKEHCRKYHSNRSRAEYLIDITMKVIGGEKIDLSEYGL